MNCKLCLKDTVLVSSHIIPEFLYTTLYDSKHRFEQISVEPTERNKYVQKGLRETLLCEPCELSLSVLEQYFSKLLKGEVAARTTRGDGHMYLTGVDYCKLKLFQVSILWRAGVSSLEPFSQVKLGSHEERLRIMLLSNDPGSAARYGCLMFSLMNGKESLTGLLIPPTWSKLAGQKAYRFVFGGLVFVYLVSNTNPPVEIIDAFAQPDGSVSVRSQQLSEMKYLADPFAQMHKFGKLAEK